MYFPLFMDILELAIQNKRWTIAIPLKAAIWKNKLKLWTVSIDIRFMKGILKGIYSKFKYGSWLTYDDNNTKEVGLSPD